jgi:hypothetical protein
MLVITVTDFVLLFLSEISPVVELNIIVTMCPGMVVAFKSFELL